MAIKVLITGGTIDNLEYDAKIDAPTHQKTIIPLLLKNARISLKHTAETVVFKDSKFIEDRDRALIYKKCKECHENKIIITHGTMALQTTAQYLGKRRLRKTIVLLGAAIPGNKKNSDALFNIGTAFAAVQILPHGVYVTMNGKIFSWDNVKKNLATCYFENLKK